MISDVILSKFKVHPLTYIKWIQCYKTAGGTTNYKYLEGGWGIRNTSERLRREKEKKGRKLHTKELHKFTLISS
jgi:hypothetical protein